MKWHKENIQEENDNKKWDKTIPNIEETQKLNTHTEIQKNE